MRRGMVLAKGNAVSYPDAGMRAFAAARVLHNRKKRH